MDTKRSKHEATGTLLTPSASKSSWPGEKRKSNGRQEALGTPMGKLASSRWSQLLTSMARVTGHHPPPTSPCPHSPSPRHTLSSPPDTLSLEGEGEEVTEPQLRPNFH